MATHKVGGEVDAFCTRCKMTLAHTILAMVGTKIARVRCNTCNGDHAYRAEPGKTTTTPRKTKASSGEGAVPKAIISWQERIAAKNPATAKKYSVKETFAVEDLVDHPTFGIGIVSVVRGDKIDVAFKGEQKTLMHGKSGGVGGEKPKYQPPTSTASGPADKPVKDDGAAPPPAAAAEESSPEPSQS